MHNGKLLLWDTQYVDLPKAATANEVGEKCTMMTPLSSRVAAILLEIDANELNNAFAC